MGLFLGENAVDLFGGQPVRSESVLSSLTATPTTSIQNFTPTSDIDGWDSVTVNAIPSQYIIPTGVINITNNGTVDVSQYASANVQISQGGISLQVKTITPTEAEQVVTADSGYDGLSSVTVGAISSSYVGTGITRRDDSDLTASGNTVTVPAGYYAAQESKAIANGSAITPATTISTNPSISVSSAGLITATVSGSESITPTVSAGYVSAGTAGTVTVSGSNTSQLTTLGATTYNTSTTNQTISSGRYLTGTQTIRAVTTSNITAANIKAGTTVMVGDANDSDRILNVTGTFTADATAAASDIVSGQTAYVNGSKITGSLVVQKYYTGSSAPSSSLGENGDIYIQS